MPEDTKKTKLNQDRAEREDVFVPDFSELWKELYFKTENAWAEAFKEFISTKTFVSYLDKILEKNLAYEKVTRQSIDKYFELSPVPSKKDLARVAELVISLEEKIDTLEFQFFQNLEKMADSFLKMVSFQESVRDELDEINKNIEAVNKKLDNLSKKVNTLSKDAKAGKKAQETKKNQKPVDSD